MLENKNTVDYNMGIDMINQALGNQVERIYVYDMSVSGRHTGDGKKMEYYAFQVKLVDGANERQAEDVLCDLFAGNEHFSAVLYSPYFEKEGNNKQRRVTIWLKS